MRLFPHHHKMVRISVNGRTYLFCSCGKTQTVLNYKNEQEETIDGIIDNIGDTILVFAGSEHQFYKVREILSRNTSINATQLEFATVRNLHLYKLAHVCFYGNWWDNPDYQDERVNTFLNKCTI